MKEQKVLVFADTLPSKIENKVNSFLDEGWTIISVTAQHVSTGSSQFMSGGYFIIFERTILNQI